MDREQEDQGASELAQVTLQANKEHLNALKAYTQELEAELQGIDKLLETVEAIDESDLDVECSFTIPGAIRATAPIATKELLSPESPFHEDALKRSRYQRLTEVHPMKTKELETLAGAVQAENRRKHALDLQGRGCPAFPNTDVQTTHTLEPITEDIDWDRVSDKVSAVSMTTRTARECEIRWLGDRHPGFNHEPWSQEEVLKVKSLSAEFVDSQPDWVVVATRLGTRRTPLDCMRHATSRRSHQWTTEADERLLKAIRMYGHDNWHLVARYVSEDATPSQCSNRFQKTLDESIKRTAWSPEEDARLSAAVAVYGSSWVDVAANVPGRHNDQCRERWTEHLNPKINRSQWSQEEDRLLLDYVREYKGAWKEISQRFGNGRTEAMCRNRHTVLQHGSNSVPTMPAVDFETQVSLVDQATTSSNFSSTNANGSSLEPSFPTPYHPLTTPAPPQTGQHQSQLVFLEPMVDSSSGSCRPRSSKYVTRFKAMTGSIEPSNTTSILPSKKRKPRPRARSNKPSAEAQRESTS